MTDRQTIWGVHHDTMVMMAKGMTTIQLDAAVHGGRPLTLIEDDDTEVTGTELFKRYCYLCLDAQEDL